MTETEVKYCECGCGLEVLPNKYGRPRKYYNRAHASKAYRNRKAQRVATMPYHPSQVLSSVMDTLRNGNREWWEAYLTHEEMAVAETLAFAEIAPEDFIAALERLQNWQA